MAHDPTKARKGGDEANHYAARLLQHLVVPTFVIDADRRVVVWNRACERLTGVSALEVLGTRNHWQAFYEDNRYCLADLVALGRQDLIGELYSEFVVTQDDRLGSSAENWCMKLAPVTAWFVRERPRLKVVETGITVEPLGVSVRKGDVAVREAINSAQAGLAADGTLGSISMKRL